VQKQKSTIALHKFLGTMLISMVGTATYAQQPGPGELVIPNATSVLQSPNQNAAIGMTPQSDWRFSLNLRGTTSAPNASKGLDIWTNTVFQSTVGGGYSQIPAPDVFRVFSSTLQYGVFQFDQEVYKIDGQGNVTGGSFLGRADNQFRLGHTNNFYTFLNNDRLEWRRPTDNQPSFMQLAENGNVGINAPAPETTLHIKTLLVPPTEEPINGYHTTFGLIVENDGIANGNYAMKVRTGLGDVFRLSNNGHLYLGEDLNGAFFDEYRLYVQTGIRTERIRVDVANANGWADYVFEEDYELMPTEELESFIKKHKHLPGVPSAADVVRDGIDLAEMNKILLEKIEELTLRVIELEKAQR
jgi:hypothetical protein